MTQIIIAAISPNTENSTCQHQQWLQYLIPFVSGAVVAGLGYYFAIRRDDRNRRIDGKSKFFDTTAELHSRLIELRSTPEAYFVESLPILRRSIRRVKPFARDYLALEQAWREYDSTPKHRFSGMQGALNKVIPEGITAAQHDSRDSYERLRDHLDQFDKYVA